MSADKRQCDKLDGKLESEVCMVDGYPVATGDQIDTPIIHEMIEECKIIHVRPEDYLNLVPPPPGWHEPSLKKIKARLRNKEPLDIPWINFTEQDCGWQWKLSCVTGQEGRHRARVAKEAGLKKIPVLLCKKRL